MRALPAVARRVSSSPDSYVYLAESIRAWPDQRALGEPSRPPAGREVAYRNLSGGIVALHRAVRAVTGTAGDCTRRDETRVATLRIPAVWQDIVLPDGTTREKFHKRTWCPGVDSSRRGARPARTARAGAP